MKPPRGYESLRRYRVSIPRATYFLTLCTNRRTTGLTEPPVVQRIKSELEEGEKDGAFVFRSAVIMPDHVHLLIQITGQQKIGQIVGRLKAKTRSVLLAGNLRWQDNFYEHRMRPDDQAEDVLRYMFLNPYRANLVRLHEAYPHYWLSAADAEWFDPTRNELRTLPTWLM